MTTTQGTRRGWTVAWGIVTAALMVSMWLRHAFPIFALGDAMYDDVLFVRTADYLLSRDWLGPYGKLTLAKGAAYPMFVAVNGLTGFPLKMAEHFVYLCCSLYFAWALARVLRSRTAFAACFVVLAFNPVVWAPEVGGRVVREGLYTSLSLLLPAMAMRAFLDRRAESLRDDFIAKRKLLIGYGITGAFFWLTREEGVWLVPALAIPVLYWLAVTARRDGIRRESCLLALRFAALPLVSFALVVGAVDARNWSKYGVFRNNDFRSSDFPAAYGALSRIPHEAWRRYVVFPKDAREKAYAVSPAARQLKPSLDGPNGEFWRRTGCRQTITEPCPEILSGWFMWALRDAAEAAGHYTSATEARRFYSGLASEVNEACDRGEIACGPPRSTLIPPWRDEFLEWTAEASSRIFFTLLTLGHMQVRVHASEGSKDRLADFARVTHGPIASAADVGSEDVRRSIATVITVAYQQALPYAFPIAIGAWIALLILAAFARHWHPGHAVAASLAAAIAVRIVLLGFLEATSIPSDYILYLSPVVPITLAFPVCVAFLLLAGHARDDGNRPVHGP